MGSSLLHADVHVPYDETGCNKWKGGNRWEAQDWLIGTIRGGGKPGGRDKTCMDRGLPWSMAEQYSAVSSVVASHRAARPICAFSFQPLFDMLRLLCKEQLARPRRAGSAGRYKAYKHTTLYLAPYLMHMPFEYGVPVFKVSWSGLGRRLILGRAGLHSHDILTASKRTQTCPFAASLSPAMCQRPQSFTVAGTACASARERAGG